jgi:hypothetical protein
MFCLVRTNPDVKPQEGITFLLVPMQQKGITIRPIITLAGDHEVNQVFLDDAETHAQYRIGEEGQVLREGPVQVGVPGRGPILQHGEVRALLRRGEDVALPAARQHRSPG